MNKNKEKEPTVINNPTISTEAEQDILGSIIIDEKILPDIKAIIEPGYFYLSKHRVIYNAILDLDKAQKPIDINLIAEKLTEIGKLDDIGKRSYLVELADGVVSTVNAVHYAKLVKEKYQLREMVTQLDALMDKINQGESNTEVVNSLNQIISKVSLPDFFGRPPLTIHDRADDLLVNLIHTDPALPSGHNQLDRALGGGYQKGRMYIIDGLTGGGKSTFALNIADDLAEAGDVIPVMIVFELTATEILFRSISRKARIDSKYLESRVWSNEKQPYKNLTPEHIQFIKRETLKTFEDYKDGLGRSLYILDDTTGWTTAIVKSVVSQIKRLNENKDIILIIDPVQMLLTGDKTADREPTLRTGLVAGQCKQLARDLYIPVVLLSDTTKEAQARKERGEKISLADIRGSFELSQRADVTLHINYGKNIFDNIRKETTEPDYIDKVIDRYNTLASENSEAMTTQAYIKIGKQRTGDCRTAYYAWHRAYNHFKPIIIEGYTDPETEYKQSEYDILKGMEAQQNTDDPDKDPTLQF